MVPTLSVGIQTFRININYEEKKVFLFGIVWTGGTENPWKYQVSKGFCFNEIRRIIFFDIFVFLTMNYVYINYSEKFDKFYIGQTNDFESRLKLHNLGLVTSTKPYAPWINKLLIIKSNRSEAISLEKKLKNLNRQRLLAFIEKYKDNYGSDAFGRNSDIPN
jgi:putative endonuclease